MPAPQLLETSALLDIKVRAHLGAGEVQPHARLRAAQGPLLGSGQFLGLGLSLPSVSRQQQTCWSFGRSEE